MEDFPPGVATTAADVTDQIEHRVETLHVVWVVEVNFEFTQQMAVLLLSRHLNILQKELNYVFRTHRKADKTPESLMFEEVVLFTWKLSGKYLEKELSNLCVHQNVALLSI